MKKEEIARKLEFYPRGISVHLKWDRGNGELERDYIYLGNNAFDGTPMLADSENFYNGTATFFDFPNPDLFIKDIAVTTHNSIEELINLK